MLSAGKWRAHSGFLLLFPSHAGLLWSRQDRSHPGEEGRESPLSLEAAAGITLPLLPQGQLGQESTGHGYGFSLGRAGAGWWHPSNSATAALVSPWHGHSLGSERAALPRGPGSGHPLPRTNPSKPLRGLGSAWWGGVSLQSKLLSRAMNLQSASDCVLWRGTGNSVSTGGGTKLGDEPLGRQEETSLLAQAFLPARILLPAGLESWERLPG